MAKQFFKREVFTVLLGLFRWFFLPILILFTASLFVIQIYYPNFQKRFFEQYVDFSTPVIRVVNMPASAYSSTMHWLEGWLLLKANNDQLSTENKKLKAYHASALTLKLEVSRLQQLSKALPRLPFDYSSVSFLSVDQTDFMQSILLEAGKEEGLFLDQIGLIDGMLAGRIIGIGDHAARFLLLTDMHMHIPVEIGKKGTKAIIVGQNSDLLRLKYVPIHYAPKVGEVIFTSGEGGVFPKSIPIGTIISVEKDVIFVHPYVSLEGRNYIQMIMNPPKRV